METIIKNLKENNFVELISTNKDLLQIHFKRFHGNKPEFLFILNSKPIVSFKTIKTAKIKINKFIDNGFLLKD